MNNSRLEAGQRRFPASFSREDFRAPDFAEQCQGDTNRVLEKFLLFCCWRGCKQFGLRPVWDFLVCEIGGGSEVRLNVSGWNGGQGGRDGPVCV